MAAAKMKAKARPSQKERVSLPAREVLAALPSMSKEEKRRLQQHLTQEEQLYAPTRAMTGWGAEEPWNPGGEGLQHHGYEAGRMEGVSVTGARGSGSQAPVAPSKDKSKVLKDKELAQMRKALYEERVDGTGRLKPSTASPTPTEEQARCKHPFPDLKWSGNAEGHYARCKKCDLKHVIYHSHRHGTLVVSQEHPPPQQAPPEAKVWIQEAENATTFQSPDSHGPDRRQICIRVTRSTEGRVLEQRKFHGNETLAEWSEPLRKPQHLVTEFWYMPVSEIHEEGFIQVQKASMVIADSGCRNSVGGELWHDRYQKMLRSKGLPWQEIEEHEVYRFGAGKPIVSRTAYLYPVQVHGKCDVIRMSKVGSDGRGCPGLIGPGELSRWNAVFVFGTKEIEFNHQRRPMQLTATRHPGVDLLDDAQEFEQLKKFWKSEEGLKMKKQLTTRPQSLAFITTAGDDDDDDDDDEEPVESETSQEEEDEEEAGEEGDEKGRTRFWMKRLEDDLGIMMIPTVEAHSQEGDGEESSSGSDEEQDRDSDTSHEQGVEEVTDDSSEEAKDDDLTKERHGSYVVKKELHKGLRRKIGHGLREIKEGFRHEEERSQQKQQEQRQQQQHRQDKHVPAAAASPKKKKWSVLEVFTWTCAISIAAACRGWHAHEPISLPHWDLMKDKDYTAALKYIDDASPDLLVIAWPCTVWSRLQTLGRRTPYQRYRLQRRRKQQRKLLRFTRDASLRQRRRKKALVGENPHLSLAWDEGPVQEAFAGMAEGVTDLCQFGLRVPRGDFLRKRTRLRGTKEVIKHATKRCQGTHKHQPVLGGMKFQGKWMNISEFAGGYTPDFANAILDGAEEFLQGDREEVEVLAEGPEVPEEEHELVDEEADPEEEDGELEDKDEKWKKIQRIHHRLGHPTNKTLVRMLALGGASKDLVERASKHECPVCQESTMPGRYLKAKAEVRPTVFGREVHCDLKYLHDAKNILHVALSMVDAATSFHAAVLLRNRNAAHVAKKFMRHWCSLYGSPEAITHDQGGEFDGAFVGWMESHGIQSKISGARSPWQHGFCERHGALLGTACTSLIWSYKAEGRDQMKQCLCAAVQAKNCTLTRKGYTPYQLVYGRHPTFPDLLDEEVDGNLSLRQSLTLDGEVARGDEMRAAARATLLRQDVREKLRRVLKRWPRGEEAEFSPGKVVFFYVPKPKTARFRKDPGAWRGPAIVILKESTQRYFVSWRGRCLLVSAPNIRRASMAESANHQHRAEEAEETEMKLQDEQEYDDLSQAPRPPAEGEDVWKAEEGIVVPQGGSRSKKAAIEIAKTLRGTRKSVLKMTMKKKRDRNDEENQKRRRRHQEKRKEKKKHKEEAEQSAGATPESGNTTLEEPQQTPPATAQLTPAEELPPVPDDWHEEDTPPADEQVRNYSERLRQHLLDDVPRQFKRGVSEVGNLDEESIRKRFRSVTFQYVMVANSQRGRWVNEWASRSEVQRLASLLDLPLSGVRYHNTPRKRLQAPQGKRRRGRTTVMLSKEGTAMVCQETPQEVADKPKRKAPQEWRGMTLFLKEEKQNKDNSQEVFVEMPGGVYAVKVEDSEEWKNLKEQEVENQAFAEAFLLINKANGKELDPRFFNTQEAEAFREADRKEWESWIKNNVVRRLTPEELKKVDKQHVFTAPARMVRVNKGAMEGILKAKSRMVLPGHTDPGLGSFRSDAPTTLRSAVQLTKIIASTHRWLAYIFDVSTAFLSGKEVERLLYMKAPIDGLPPCPELGVEAVSPGELLRVCKSAYGLSEAPRLWYMRAKELLEEIGFLELTMARATFVLKQNDQVVAILCLHVDDGLLVASPETMKLLQKEISQRFSIKEWQKMGEEPVTFLGVKTTYKGGIFIDDMTDYVSKIEFADVNTAEDSLLQDSQLSSFRRLVMQLRWPAHFVMPEFLYKTSDLAQRVSGALGRDLRHANLVLKHMKEAAVTGNARIELAGFQGKPIFVTYFDASLGKSNSARAQQGEIHLLTTHHVLKGSARASILEFHSNRVHKVVRSSLAAEGCAMVSASDRQLFNRVLFDALMYGKIEITKEWRQNLTTEGWIVTDAKGLHDHVHKTGGVASEKQAALDILMTKQLVEDGVQNLKWTPTWKQLADPLTNDMDSTVLHDLRRSWTISLVQTEADQVEEDRRAGLRKAQRERRKIKMKTLQHFSSPMRILRDVAQLGEFDMSSFAFCPQASTLLLRST